MASLYCYLFKVSNLLIGGNFPFQSNFVQNSGALFVEYQLLNISKARNIIKIILHLIGKKATEKNYRKDRIFSEIERRLIVKWKLRKIPSPIFF